MKKMPTQLLQYLVKECTKEVLDQLIQEKKLKVKHAADNEKADEVPIKHKIPVKTKTEKNAKFYVQPKKVNEEELPQGTPSDTDPSMGGGNAPETPSPEPKPEEPQTPEAPISTPPAKGPVVINPRDKSKLEPVRFSGHDDAAIERTLHLVATRTAGPRTKVSLGAKRLGREAASNPGAAVFFYFGKIDPESDEVFLMADKSLQIAKDDSVQPSYIQGVPAAAPAAVEPGEEIPSDDPHHFQFMTGKVRPKPRYGGIDESTQSLIKKAVNQILDRR